jgi:hypothetical protein
MALTFMPLAAGTIIGEQSARNYSRNSRTLTAHFSGMNAFM